MNNGTQKDISRESAVPRTTRPQPSEISPTMRENLRHLKNVLKLPKAVSFLLFKNLQFIYFSVE